MYNYLPLKCSFVLGLALAGSLLTGCVLAAEDVDENSESVEMNLIFLESENATLTRDGELEDHQLMALEDARECTSANLTVNKTSYRNFTVEGSEIEYIIEICNTGDVAVHNIEVRDVFQMMGDGAGVKFVSADPEPDAGFIWCFDSLPSGKSLKISIIVKVPKSQKLEFSMEQGVSGSGFVKVLDDYSYTFEPYVIKNFVYVSSDETPTISDCAAVTVFEGLYADLTTNEHGSGRYESEELVRLKSDNSSIKMDKDASSTFEATSIGLYNNRTISFSSRWTGEARAKNRLTGASMSESYRYASSIDRESRMMLDVNGSVMEIDSEFEGMGHIRFLKMPRYPSEIQSLPTFESREDYAGSFKVHERIKERSCPGEYLSFNEHIYGVDSDKAVSGSGFASEDKRIRDTQRTYEYGTGTFESEELIRTRTNYISKDLSFAHAPLNQRLTDNSDLNQSMALKEGIYSRNMGLSYIGEKYTGVTHLDKETVARGLNEMETEANFSGVAKYRLVVEDMAKVDEQYEGEYSIGMSILVKGIPKYDRPHLKINKTATLYQLPEETIAKYSITLENDGNAALGPIYVRDVFPPESEFLGSSLRPTDLTESSARWTLTHLSIGDSRTITICLNVTDNRCPELISFAEVMGGYDGRWVMANFTSSLEMESMSGPTASFNVTGAEALRGCDESSDVCEIACKIPCENMMLELYSIA